ISPLPPVAAPIGSPSWSHHCPQRERERERESEVFWRGMQTDQAVIGLRPRGS
ncbi:unnamed protein product, partial [Musa textilis]